MAEAIKHKQEPFGEAAGDLLGEVGGSIGTRQETTAAQATSKKDGCVKNETYSMVKSAEMGAKEHNTSINTADINEGLEKATSWEERNEWLLVLIERTRTFSEEYANELEDERKEVRNFEEKKVVTAVDILQSMLRTENNNLYADEKINYGEWKQNMDAINTSTSLEDLRKVASNLGYTENMWNDLVSSATAAVEEAMQDAATEIAKDMLENERSRIDEDIEKLIEEKEEKEKKGESTEEEDGKIKKIEEKKKKIEEILKSEEEFRGFISKVLKECAELMEKGQELSEETLKKVVEETTGKMT